MKLKFRKNKTGIKDVRNAVSIVLDVNQNNSPIREQSIFLPKYQYVYSIFSTSGFTEPAMNLAIAYQISLIDMSGDEYSQLRNAIKETVSGIIAEVNGELEVDRGMLVSGLRTTLRKELGTLPVCLNESDAAFQRFSDNCREHLTPVLSTAKEYSELFVGMANGPFMLLLKPDNPDHFLKFAKQRRSHRVVITWSSSEDGGKTWKISPADESTKYKYKLSFRLPERLYKWIFDTEREKRKRTFCVKQKYFSNITIYRYEGETDYLFRLQFDPEATLEYARR